MTQHPRIQRIWRIDSKQLETIEGFCRSIFQNRHLLMLRNRATETTFLLKTQFLFVLYWQDLRKNHRNNRYSWVCDFPQPDDVIGTPTDPMCTQQDCTPLWGLNPYSMCPMLVGTLQNWRLGLPWDGVASDDRCRVSIQVPAECAAGYSAGILRWVLREYFW